MKFDLWTFIFQIVNFVVLLFILKRLLFKPIREIMEKRRKAISDALGEAAATKQDAERLKGELEEELRTQKKLRQETESVMRAEVDEERKRLLEAARKDAEKVIEKERAVFEIEKKKFEGGLREQAVGTVSLFASNVLRDISDETLHRSIIRKFQDEVKNIASDMAGTVRPGTAVALKVATAYSLTGDETETIRNAFKAALSADVDLSFETDTALIAGIAVRVDDKIYDFSLQGQIRTIGDRLAGTGNSWKS